MARVRRRAVKYERDKNYYFHDGSFVILVEDRLLFKIHRSLFQRDSAFLQTLLSLPQKLASFEDGLSSDGDMCDVEGKSDEDPIVCKDSVEDFRALCWAIYSGPKDLAHQWPSITPDVPKLISLVAISHKYKFTMFCNWALEVLDTYSAQHPTTLISQCQTWEQAGRILRLAYDCGRPSLAWRLETEWINRISYPRPTDSLFAFISAVDFAEGSLEYRRFHGMAYYAYIRTVGIMNSTVLNNAPSVQLGSVPSYTHQDLSSLLGEERKARLCRGYWSLAYLRLKLSSAPELGSVPSCPSHTHVCIPAWQTWWRAAVYEAESNGGGRLNDPGELLQVIRGILNVRPVCAADYQGQVVAIQCYDLIHRELECMFDDFMAKIPDYFAIPET